MRRISLEGNNWAALLTILQRPYGILGLVLHLPPSQAIDRHTSTPPAFRRSNLQEKLDTPEKMNPTAGQNTLISLTSNCGNVTDSYKTVLNNCEISIANEKHVLLKWLSPLEPRERHQAIGVGRVARVGEWLLLTSEFTRWNENRDGTVSPVLLCYGDPGVGKTYLRYE